MSQRTQRPKEWTIQGVALAARESGLTIAQISKVIAKRFPRSKHAAQIKRGVHQFTYWCLWNQKRRGWV